MERRGRPHLVQRPGSGHDSGTGLRASDTTTSASGTVSQQFVWGIAGDQLLMDSANAYVYAGGQAPAEQVNLSTGGVSYLVGDSIGSVRGIVNSAGSLVATTSYDAWGNPQASDGLTSYTPFGFAGGYTDPTGLIYLIDRYYDPATGQFISVDPDVSQTGEPYAYTGGDPVNEVDPTGDQFFIPVDCGHCLFSSEKEFENELFSYMAPVAQAIGQRAYQQQRTAMRACSFPTGTGCRTRIPDIYIWNPNGDHGNGWGWINELKIGPQNAGPQNSKEVVDDKNLLQWRGGVGWSPNPNAGTWQNVDLDIWWFAPNLAGVTAMSLPLALAIWKAGINIVFIQHVPGARNWPRNENKDEKEKDVEEIESGDTGEEFSGLDDTFGPCAPPSGASCPTLP
jgi:RHS repeat-associated protein